MNILVVSSLVLVEKMDKGIGCDSQTVTAAVSVGAYILYDESQSLGNREGRIYAQKLLEASKGISQKTYKRCFTFHRRNTAVATSVATAFCFAVEFGCSV